MTKSTSDDALNNAEFESLMRALPKLKDWKTKEMNSA